MPHVPYATHAWEITSQHRPDTGLRYLCDMTLYILYIFFFPFTPLSYIYIFYLTINKFFLRIIHTSRIFSPQPALRNRARYMPHDKNLIGVMSQICLNFASGLVAHGLHLKLVKILSLFSADFIFVFYFYLD